MKTVDRLSKGKSNFEIVLASQNCVFGKASLSFNPKSKKNEFPKPYSKLSEKQQIEESKQRVVTCFFAWREATQLDSTILGNILFLKVL